MTTAATESTDTTPYDAFLLVSFGGPEGPDDVLPFLQNVTRGRGIPPERLLEVGEHYVGFGGVSPINGQNRALVAAIEADFAAHGLDLPVYWGNRNWAPYLTDELARIAADGRRRVLALFTSAYSSYSGCRQYREDLAAAVTPLGEERPRGRPDPALLQPPRFRGDHGGEHGHRPRRPPGRRPPGGAAGLRHPLGAPDHGRGQRARGARLHHPASRRGPAGDRRRRRGDRPRPRARPRLLQPQRLARPTVARARRQRPPRGAGGRRCAGRRAGADRLRLRPHGGGLRPRHRGPADRPAARAAGGAGGHGRHRRRVRRRGPRAGARAGRRRARCGAGTPGTWASWAPATTSARPAAVPTPGTPSRPALCGA